MGHGTNARNVYFRGLREHLDFPSLVVDPLYHGRSPKDNTEVGGALFPLPSIGYDFLSPFLEWTHSYMYSNRVYNENRVDLFHLSNPKYINPKLPYVMSLDGTFLQAQKIVCPPFHWTKRKIIFTLERRIYQNAKKIICLTEFARQSVLQDYGIELQRTCVIPPGVDLKTFRTRQRDGSEEVSLLFVATNFKIKGGYLVLEAFEKLRKEHSVKLLVVGPKIVGEQKDIEFLGKIDDRNRLAEIYRSADILVHPGSVEMYGFAFLEAMASELPIVTPDVPPRREIVGKAALFFRLNDVNDLVSKITKLIEDRDLREKLGKNGRRIAERKHDWSRIAKRIQQIYRVAIFDQSYKDL